MYISIPSVLRIKPNAIYKLGKYIRKMGIENVALFYGEGIEGLAEKVVNISFDSSEIKAVVKDVIKESEIRDVMERYYQMPYNVQAVVGIGGGKVIDCCKYIAHVAKLPIISVPTSISNDGFSSSVSSLNIDGKKKSFKSKIPDAVIVDTEIVKNSPKKFIFSGVGDLISNITAIYDWKLAAKKGFESVNDFAVLISNNAVENMINYSNKNIDNIEFIRLISGSLVMNGIAMEISGSSRPSSGSEHLISHAYDKSATVPSLHGIQVGVATYCISYIQNNKFELIKNALTDVGFFDFVSQNKLEKDAFLVAVDRATSMKENFYTILSEKGNIEKLKEFVEKDEICTMLFK